MTSADDSVDVRPSWARYRAKIFTLNNLITGVVIVVAAVTISGIRHGGVSLGTVGAALAALAIMAGGVGLYLRNVRVSIAGTVLTQRLWWGGTVRWPLTAVRRAIVIEFEDAISWTPNTGGPMVALFDEDGVRLLRVGGSAWAMPDFELVLARLPHTDVHRHPGLLRFRTATQRYPEVFRYRERHPNIFGIGFAVALLAVVVAVVFAVQYLLAPA